MRIHNLLTSKQLINVPRPQKKRWKRKPSIQSRGGNWFCNQDLLTLFSPLENNGRHLKFESIPLLKFRRFLITLIFDANIANRGCIMGSMCKNGGRDENGLCLMDQESSGCSTCRWRTCCPLPESLFCPLLIREGTKIAHYTGLWSQKKNNPCTYSIIHPASINSRKHEKISTQRPVVINIIRKLARKTKTKLTYYARAWVMAIKYIYFHDLFN